MGDPAAVNVAFEDRERHFQRLAFVVKSLTAGRAEGTGVDGLRAALRQVNDAPEEMHEWLAHVRGNVQRALDGKVTIEPDRYLWSLIRSAEEERDRVAPHRRVSNK